MDAFQLVCLKFIHRALMLILLLYTFCTLTIISVKFEPNSYNVKPCMQKQLTEEDSEKRISHLCYSCSAICLSLAHQLHIGVSSHDIVVHHLRFSPKLFSLCVDSIPSSRFRQSRKIFINIKRSDLCHVVEIARFIH